MWDGIYADSLIQLRHIFIQYRFFIETTLSFCRVLPSQSSLTDRKVFCKAMLCFLWSTWVVRKCCFLLQTHRRQSIMDFPQPRYRNAKNEYKYKCYVFTKTATAQKTKCGLGIEIQMRVQIQILCIYKHYNSREDKVCWTFHSLGLSITGGKLSSQAKQLGSLVWFKKSKGCQNHQHLFL